MKAADIIRELELTPATCGYMRQTWNNSHGAALYFLITPERPGAVDSLNADQIYHFYAGGPLEVAFLNPPGQVEQHVLGAFGVCANLVPQWLVVVVSVAGFRSG